MTKKQNSRVIAGALKQAIRETRNRTNTLLFDNILPKEKKYIFIKNYSLRFGDVMFKQIDGADIAILDSGGFFGYAQVVATENLSDRADIVQRIYGNLGGEALTTDEARTKYFDFLI
tara:strand:+ start:74 stop:424 length:351 start_codon:yes stop_codon:yes gene_type:complete